MDKVDILKDIILTSYKSLLDDSNSLQKKQNINELYGDKEENANKSSSGYADTTSLEYDDNSITIDGIHASVSVLSILIERFTGLRNGGENESNTSIPSLFDTVVQAVKGILTSSPPNVSKGFDVDTTASGNKKIRVEKDDEIEKDDENNNYLPDSDVIIGHHHQGSKQNKRGSKDNNEINANKKTSNEVLFAFCIETCFKAINFDKDQQRVEINMEKFIEMAFQLIQINPVSKNGIVSLLLKKRMQDIMKKCQSKSSKVDLVLSFKESDENVIVAECLTDILLCLDSKQNLNEFGKIIDFAFGYLLSNNITTEAEASFTNLFLKSVKLNKFIDCLSYLQPLIEKIESNPLSESLYSLLGAILSLLVGTQRSTANKITIPPAIIQNGLLQFEKSPSIAKRSSSILNTCIEISNLSQASKNRWSAYIELFDSVEGLSPHLFSAAWDPLIFVLFHSDLTLEKDDENNGWKLDKVWIKILLQKAIYRNLLTRKYILHSILTALLVPQNKVSTLNGRGRIINNPELIDPEFVIYDAIAVMDESVIFNCPLAREPGGGLAPAPKDHVINLVPELIQFLQMVVSDVLKSKEERMKFLRDYLKMLATKKNFTPEWIMHCLCALTEIPIASNQSIKEELKGVFGIEQLKDMKLIALSFRLFLKSPRLYRSLGCLIYSLQFYLLESYTSSLKEDESDYFFQCLVSFLAACPSEIYDRTSDYRYHREDKNEPNMWLVAHQIINQKFSENMMRVTSKFLFGNDKTLIIQTQELAMAWYLYSKDCALPYQMILDELKQSRKDQITWQRCLYFSVKLSEMLEDQRVPRPSTLDELLQFTSSSYCIPVIQKALFESPNHFDFLELSVTHSTEGMSSRALLTMDSVFENDSILSDGIGHARTCLLFLSLMNQQSQDVYLFIINLFDRLLSLCVELKESNNIAKDSSPANEQGKSSGLSGMDSIFVFLKALVVASKLVRNFTPSNESDISLVEKVVLMLSTSNTDIITRHIHLSAYVDAHGYQIIGRTLQSYCFTLSKWEALSYICKISSNTFELQKVLFDSCVNGMEESNTVETLSPLLECFSHCSKYLIHRIENGDGAEKESTLRLFDQITNNLFEVRGNMIIVMPYYLQAVFHLDYLCRPSLFSESLRKQWVAIRDDQDDPFVFIELVHHCFQTNWCNTQNFESLRSFSKEVVQLLSNSEHVASHEAQEFAAKPGPPVFIIDGIHIHPRCYLRLLACSYFERILKEIQSYENEEQNEIAKNKYAWVADEILIPILNPESFSKQVTKRLGSRGGKGRNKLAKKPSIFKPVHLLQSACLLSRFCTLDNISRVLEAIIKVAVLGNTSLSRYYIELAMTRILILYPDQVMPRLLELLSDYDLFSPAIGSILVTITVALCSGHIDQKWIRANGRRILDAVLPFVLCPLGPVRTIVQFLCRRMFTGTMGLERITKEAKPLIDLTESNVTPTEMKLSEFLLRNHNLQDILSRTGRWIEVFDPVKECTLVGIFEGEQTEFGDLFPVVVMDKIDEDLEILYQMQNKAHDDEHFWFGNKASRYGWEIERKQIRRREEYNARMLETPSDIDLSSSSSSSSSSSLLNTPTPPLELNYQRKPVQPDQIITEVVIEKKRELIVIASLITRIPNLAGLVRTCEIMGVKTLTFDSKSTMKDPEFINISVSADKWLNIQEVPAVDLLSYLTLAHETEEYIVVGLEQTSNSISLQDLNEERLIEAIMKRKGGDFNYDNIRKVILLLGNEEKGIPSNLLDQIDVTIEIPQRGVVRSLNVHVSGAICIWQLVSQCNL